MKKVFVSFIIFLAGLTSVFASGKTSTDPVLEKQFSKQFPGAENTVWTKVDHDFRKATFVLNGSRVEAYYTYDGELLGTARNLFYNQLPLLVIQSISKRFKDAVYIEVKEYTNSEGTSYRILLEQKDRKYSTKVSSLGDISDLRKLKKNQ